MQISSKSFSIFKWLCIIVITPLVLLFCFYWLPPDETLAPEVKAIFDASPQTAAASNAYYPIWGLAASPELDAHQVGLDVVAGYREAYAAKGLQAKFDYQRYLGVSPLVIKSGDSPWCSREKPQCLQSYLDARTEIEALISARGLYLARYRALRGYASFEDTMPITLAAPLPSYQAAIHLSALVDADISYAMSDPAKRKDALHELANEIGLWRKLGEKTNTLIGKMISIAILERKYRLLSDLMAQYPAIVRDHAVAVEAMSEPITPGETNLRAPLTREHAWQGQLFSAMTIGGFVRGFGEMVAMAEDAGNLEPKKTSMGNNPLVGVYAYAAFKPNATANGLYMWHQGAIAVTELAPHAIPSAVVPATEYSKGQFTEPSFWLYNPTGKIFAAIAAPDFKSYAYRVHDLAGYVRLVELQRQIILNAVPPARVGEFLSQSDASLYDPYTAKPMQWDQATRAISFVPRSPGRTRRSPTSVRV